MVDARCEKGLTVNETMGSNAVTAETMPQGHRVARLALALGALIAAVLLWAAPVHAWEGFHVAEMYPSDSQAGGHPNVKIQMNWDNSLYNNNEFAPPNNPCMCDDPKIAIQEFPTGFI